MTEPALQAGWYPDPWKQAELRWHDGSNWTSQLHGDPAAPTLSATPAPSTLPAAKTGTSGKAIASLVTALIGVPLVPIILGILALRDIGRSAGQLGGRGLAIAGIVLHSIWLLMVLLLLLVGIPTFLAQKQAAEDAEGKANVKLVAFTVEACATINIDGTYTGCTGAATLIEDEPALGPLLSRCGQPGGACVTPIGELGYEVEVTTRGESPSTYIERRLEDGTVERECSGPTCPSGTWKP